MLFPTTKNDVTVSVQQTFTALPVEVSVLKDGFKIYNKEIFQALVLPKINMVTTEKSKDVSKLNNFFQVPDEAKLFYKEFEDVQVT